MMLQQIEELLNADEATLDTLESTLTDGYAQALALEAERWRLERRLSEVAREGGTGLGDELSSIGQRLNVRRRGALEAPLAPRHAARARPQRAALDDAAAHGVDRRLDAVVDLQLHQDVRDVVLHRLRADVQLGGDDGVVLAVRDQLQDLDLPFGQLGPDRVRDLRLRARRANALQHLRRDVRRDERLAERRGADARHQVLDRRVLQEIAARAGEDRVHDVRVLLGDREHDDARERCDAGDVPRRIDAAHAGHVEVHDDDVRRELADDPHRLRSARRLADDLDALLLEQVPQAGPEEIVVVDDQDA